MKKIVNITLVLLLTLSLFLSCAVNTKSTTTTTTPTINSVEDSNTLKETTTETRSDSIEIIFSNNRVTASSENGVTIEGTDVSITEGGTYVLSGSSDNGSVKVKKGVQGVTLVLNGLDLTSESTAPIVCAKNSEVTITVAAGTVNSLTDSESNNDENGNVDAENAVIKCKDGSIVVICGSGTLNVNANGKNGIKSGTDGASLTIKEVTLNINAPVNDAINAETVLNVECGTITINAGDDALHSDYTLNIGAENTDGPTIIIDSCYEGLEGAVVNVYSGIINIKAIDDSINAANSDLARYDFAINIYGGTINAYTTEGDGLDSNGNLTISGGNVTVWSANSADNEPLDADGVITICGGTVLAAGGSSGMGMNLSATQPCVIFSSTTSMEMPGGQMMIPGQGMPEFNNGERPEMKEGQEMPAFNNGEMPEFNGERPDIKNSEKANFKGERANDKQMGFGGGDVLITQDSTFTITDSDGNTLYTGEATCNASYVFYSSASLSPDATYTLTSGESQIESTAQSGSISSGFGGGRGGFGGKMPNGENPPTNVL